MKKYIVAFCLSMVTVCGAMEKLSDKERVEVKDCLEQIIGSLVRGPHYYHTRERYLAALHEQFNCIKPILQQHAIDPEIPANGFSWEWVASFEARLNPVPEEEKKSLASDVDITGLDKNQVVRALWVRATPARDPLVEFLERAQLEDFTFEGRSSLRVDYLAGRAIKVDLEGDSFNPRLYDRDHGAGAAAYAVARLRKNI